MKNKFMWVLLPLACFAVSCANQTQQQKNTLQQEGLKGHVKAVYSLNYEGVNRFGEGQIVKGDPNLVGSFYKTYDTTGFVATEKTFYVLDCQKDYESTYNSLGQRIKWVSYENGSIKYNEEYEFDEHGNEVKEIDLIKKKTTNYKNTYDGEGRLIMCNEGWRTIVYDYYDNGKLKKKTTKYRYTKDNSEEYIYDDRGNLVELIDNSYFGESYYFYRYDDKNRRTDVMNCDGEDPETAKIKWKYTNYFIDDVARIPYMVKKWDEDGKLSNTTYTMYMVNLNDTLTTIKMEEGFNPVRITVNSQKGSNRINTGYEIKSGVLNDKTYNYLEGRIVSVTYDSGHNDYYEYDKGKLVKATKMINDKEKIIETYEKGRLVTAISYDSHNKPKNTVNYTYKGTEDNGSKLIVSTDKDNKTEQTELFYQNGRLTKRINTVNGLAITTTFQYNENGDVITASSSDGTAINYSYIYDGMGNWIQRAIQDGEKITITERDIRYYNFD